MTRSASDWVWLARIRKPQGRKGEVFAEILTDFPEKFAERKTLWLMPDPGTPSLAQSHRDKGGTTVGAPSLAQSHRDKGGTTVGAPSSAQSHRDKGGTTVGAPSLAQSHRDKGGRADTAALRDTSLVTGHDFSRADSTPQNLGASAPAPREVELIHHWHHKGGIVLHFAGFDSISAAETLTGLIVAIPRAQRATLPEDEVHIADLIGCTLIDVALDPPATVGSIENVDRTAGPAPLLILTGAKGEVLIPFAKTYLRKIDLENQRVEMSLPEGLADLNA